MIITLLRRELSTIHDISLGCLGPPRAYRRMRDVLEAKIRAIRAKIRAIHVRDVFSKLLQMRVGTGEVEAAARAVQGPRKAIRNVKEVMRITRRRLEDSKKDVNFKRIKWQRCEQEMKREEKEKQEKCSEGEQIKKRQWKEKAKDREKIQRLEEKAVERGYKVTDEELRKIEE